MPEYDGLLFLFCRFTYIHRSFYNPWQSMKKTSFLFYFFLIFFVFLPFFAFSQTVPPPESFLGYPLGSRFTPHFKIVNYFKQVAQAVPRQAKLEQYGATNDGRT